MARGINKVIAIGNLGQDPESKYLPSGQCVTTFSIAVNESWTDKNTGEIKERTEWIRAEAWGKLAEICAEHLKKGSQCYIEGKLQTDKWQDKDGADKYTTKVRLDSVQFLGGKPEGTTAKKSPQERQQPAEFDEDIPF